MKIYLVRHAQSAQNVMDMRARTSPADFLQVLQRSPDYPLTVEGERQAHTVAERLAGVNVDRLYSSPFKRALSTATIVGNTLGLTPIIIPELREVVPELPKNRSRHSSLRRHYLHSFARMAWTRTGPSWRSEYRRAKQAWALITQEPAEAVVAVSHAWMITMMLLALRRNRHWQIIARDVSNAGISVIERR